MYSKFVVFVVMTLVAFGAFAGVKVTNLDLRTDGPNGFVNVEIDGRSNDLPDVKVFGNTIEITLTNAVPFNAITKNVRGAILSANVLNGNKAIVRATLPYAINSTGVDVAWKGTDIELLFPRGTATSAITRAPTKEVTIAAEALAPVKEAPKAVVQEKKAEAPAPKAEPAREMGASRIGAVKKEELNEDYLNKLMNEGKDVPSAAAAAVKDEVKTGAAAPVRADAKADVPKAPGADSFSFAGYAAKFTIFLALVLGLFYGVVQVLKKGVFNKGKLGFLNNGKMIEVLSTTYVAPKKSLMIVKAHKQLFLVANSENGIQFLAEMKDTTGIIKEGEKVVTGTNFDLNMLMAEQTEETKVVIKENIMESTPVTEETPLSRIAKATDVVKFSEELKKKARKLKPIESH